MNGYIQIEINGKTVGLKFTMWALEKINQLRQQSSDSQFWNLTAMVYAGYLNNCRRKNEPPEFTLQDIDFFLDDCFSSEEGKKLIEDVSNCFSQSGVVKTNVKPEAIEEEEKKISTGNGSMSLLSENLA